MTASDEIDQRLREVVASVFGVDAAQVSEADSPDTLEAWDSANHINLMLSLEAEFGVTFEADEIAELADLGSIRRRLGEALSGG